MKNGNAVVFNLIENGEEIASSGRIIDVDAQERMVKVKETHSGDEFWLRNKDVVRVI